MFFNITSNKEEVSFHMFFKKDDPKLLRKKKCLSYYVEEEAPIEFVSKVEKYYLLFYETIEIVVNVLLNRF